MLGFLKMLFTWWDRATIGTLIFTANKGVKVGADEAGNTYYEEFRAPKGRRKRRWVVYNGTVEASRVPSEWHGWLHYTFDEPPTKAPFKTRPWEKKHVPNLTGTPFAYTPPGSLERAGERPPATGDYEAWKPN